MRGCRHHHLHRRTTCPLPSRRVALCIWGVVRIGADPPQLGNHIRVEPDHTDSQRQAPRHWTRKRLTPILEASSHSVRGSEWKGKRCSSFGNSPHDSITGTMRNLLIITANGDLRQSLGTIPSSLAFEFSLNCEGKALGLCRSKLQALSSGSFSFHGKQPHTPEDFLMRSRSTQAVEQPVLEKPCSHQSLGAYSKRLGVFFAPLGKGHNADLTLNHHST